MWAFLLAAIVFLVGTFISFVNMMIIQQGDPAGMQPFPWKPFAISWALTAVIVASHWIF